MIQWYNEIMNEYNNNYKIIKLINIKYKLK